MFVEGDLMNRGWTLVWLIAVPTVTLAQGTLPNDMPYDLRIIVRHGAHTWLGKPFRDEFRRHLSAMLTDAFGRLAQIQIVDMKDSPKEEWPPFWREVDRRGLAALETLALNESGKLHFVTVDFTGGQYEIAARQWDADTGWVSQVTQARTSDRALVGRLAGKLIAESFGIVGTLVGKGSPSGIGELKATMQIKGGILTPQLDRWVRPGDVFAVSIATNPRGDQPPRTVVQRDLLARVVDLSKNGTATVQVVYRSAENPFARMAPNQSARCIRMGTGVGPVRLRLVDDRGQPHSRTLQIRLHSQAFQEGLSPDEEVVNPDRGGLFVSRKSYDQMAFARVITGGTQIARLPVPILPDREVTAVVGIDSAQEQFGQLQAMKSELLRSYKEAVLVQIAAYNEITALVKQTKNSDALKRANSARLALERELEQLHLRKEEVRKQLAGTRISLKDCDDVEKDLENHKVRMNRLIGRLIETERLENAPDKVERKLKLQQQFNKVQVLMDSDDYDGALALLKQIAEEYPEEMNVKKQIDELERQWAIQSDAHREARDFVYREWTACKTSTDVENKLPLVRQRLAVLAQVGDRLTMLKLRNSLPTVGKILADEAKSLAESNADDAEDKRAKLKKVLEDFDRLGQEIDTAIRGGNP
jgi:hypothetical protein